MKWIKVDDRLPEVDVNVIALTSKGKVMVTSMYIPKDCRGKQRIGDGYFINDTITEPYGHEIDTREVERDNQRKII